MNKYFDNIIYFLQNSGGGSVYWGEITKVYKSKTDAFFIQPDLHSDNIVYKNMEFTNIIYEKYISLKVLRYLPCNIKIEQGSIFHSSYYRYSNQNAVKNIVTVHDFTTEHYSKGLSRLIHHKQKSSAIKNSVGIICISEKTKKDLLEFYPEYINQKKIEVIYNGVSEDFYHEKNCSKVKINFSLNEEVKYLLYIGHRTMYKNFNFAIELINYLPKNYKLLIVGNPLSMNEIKLLYKIQNKFVFLGNLSNKDLNMIYNIVECLIYPSSYEGFGIPLIEAFKCGCPVVAQNLEVFKEISGNAALLVEGLDIKAFKSKILELKKEKFRNELIQLGFKQAKNFSWNKCSTQVNDFYHSI